jgi:DNA-binding MurR/RpiR family transcriptional regulator
MEFHAMLPAMQLIATDRANAVLPRLRAALPSLQPGDARVVHFVLQDPVRVIGMTVSEVGEGSRTSASTVVRCCQKLGYSGFHDLKLALALEATPDQAVPGEIEQGDLPGDVLRKILRSDGQAIEEALATIDMRAFEQAVEALDSAKRVLFVGVGTSAPLAQDAAYRFITIGVHADAPADVHVQHVSSRLLQAGDVCFAVSHTGSTQETVAAIEAAREAGATTIALTSFVNSPLTHVAGLALVAGSRETTFRLEAMASRIAHLSVLDALLVAVAMRRPDQASRNLDAALRIVGTHRY